MSTIASSDQSSIFLYTLQWHNQITTRVIMPKTKVTPRAKHPNKTQQFLDATQIALETFEDEISSLAEEVHEKAYRNYVKAYREALVPVWNLACFADIRTVLETVTDRNMSEITTMAEHLKPTSPRPKAISDKATILDLETITTAMLQKFPGEKLPEPLTCEKIGNVYSLLSTARTAYSEAAHGLAELATLLTPQQYTLLLMATITRSIQLIVLGQMISPLSTPPPPKQESSTTTGHAEIMNFTKCKVLPNPNSSSLTDCDDNSATHVLAAVVYCQLEKNYFDETRSCSNVAGLFRCNTSQLSKAITGVEYKSGPHHYKPKKVSKREAESSTQDPTKQKEPRTADADPKEAVLLEDTLSSSSGDSNLPPGLF